VDEAAKILAASYDHVNAHGGTNSAGCADEPRGATDAENREHEKRHAQQEAAPKKP